MHNVNKNNISKIRFGEKKLSLFQFLAYLAKDLYGTQEARNTATIGDSYKLKPAKKSLVSCNYAVVSRNQDKDILDA